MRNTKNAILTVVKNHLVAYPTPININYFYGFGSLAGVFLVVQILSGVLLAMHYVPMADYAFLSVEHIMRDLNYGWFLRYTHANGSSMFFLCVYIHIARGLYYGSYVFPRHLTWISGVIVFVLMMATAFLGYFHSPKWVD
jgi:quinol-cytochrome oxidoreductase complex cytochrome b subunit